MKNNFKMRFIIYFLLIVFIFLNISCTNNVIVIDQYDSSPSQTDFEYIEGKSIDEVSENIKPFGDIYGIDIYVSEFKASNYANRWATWENPTEEDIDKLNRYIKLFVDEWSKYPVEWVRKSNVKGVALVKELAVVGQKRYAMPDAYAEVLYYDIEYEDAGEVYERSSLHHEYYHMIEENYFGDMYYKDKKWASFNPPEFKYKSSGADAYDDENYTSKDHPTHGFVTYYSLYALEEDKAETYSYLMITEKYFDVMLWIEEDKILLKKVQYMKAFIEKHCNEMNEEYWKRLHRRGEDLLGKLQSRIILSISVVFKRTDRPPIPIIGNIYTAWDFCGS